MWTSVDPEYRPSYSGAAPTAVPEDDSGMTVTADDPELMEAIRKQASEMELEAKLKVSKKDEPEVYIKVIYNQEIVLGFNGWYCMWMCRNIMPYSIDYDLHRL